MNAKISVFVICVEAIIYLLLYNLHTVPLIDLNSLWLNAQQMFDEFKRGEKKGLKSLQVKAEGHLEPKRASMMELFVNS